MTFLLAVVTLHFVVSVTLLAWISGTLAPIVVAVVAQSTWPSAVKAILNAVLAAIGGLLTVAIKANGHVDGIYWLTTIGNAMVVAWAMYHGFLKPIGLRKLHEATDTAATKAKRAALPRAA